MPDRPRRQRRLVVAGLAACALLGLVLAAAGVMRLSAWLRDRRAHTVEETPARYPPPSDFDPMAHQPLDRVPEVAPRTHHPPRKELLVSGPNDADLFDAELDLVEYHDPTIWWESDNDTDGDTENDHLVHRDLLPALIRLNALVLHEGAVLKVQDSYRAEGVHNAQSLHREGRAIDLTADRMTLGRLARLAVQAGFDWVYYESPRAGGAHVHASMRRRTQGGLPHPDRDAPPAKPSPVLADSVMSR